MVPSPPSVPSPGAPPPQATLLRDQQGAVPLTKALTGTARLILTTPVVPPLHSGPNGAMDPFEPFGRAVEARHPWITHTPYVKRNGITGAHAAFIKLPSVAVVVFVVSGLPGTNEPDQWDLAHVAQRMSEGRQFIVLACYDQRPSDARMEAFPTVAQVPGYSPAHLRAAADLLFGDHTAPPPRAALTPATPPPLPAWTVEPWTPSDMPAVHDLWTACLPPRFHLERWALAALLNRSGYAMHRIVRDPARLLLGFCASYVTYADGGGERLAGSLAVVLVREGYRGSGVGTRLHDEAMRRVRGVRGVERVQLGSVFPRLLCGVPVEMEGAAGWFERRGWDVRGGRLISDWVLELTDRGEPRAGGIPDVMFRGCEPVDVDAVLTLVGREAARGAALGFFDQYAPLADTPDIRDIIVGTKGGDVVACALVYSPESGAPVLGDLPWAGRLGEAVGGVTCVCVAGEFPLWTVLDCAGLCWTGVSGDVGS